MKKTRILFESHYLVNGGIEKVLQMLVTYLSEKDGGARYDVTVASAAGDARTFSAAYPAGAHFVQREWVRKGHKRHTTRWLFDTLRSRLYDFLITCSLTLQHYDVAVSITTGRTMLRCSHLLAKRRLCWVQRDYREFRPWGRSYVFHNPAAELRVMRRFDKVVCVSEAARDGILETMGDPGNLCVCYNPIDVRRIRAMAAEDCALRRTPGKPLLVALGRLHKEKQFELLLQLVQALSEERELELWIIGDGEERARLEAFIEREQLSCVKLLGFQANPYAYLAQADLFVSCSYTEAHPLAVQESLVLNVPVAAIRCPGVEETLDTRFGVLVNNDYEEMKAALETLLDEPERLRRYRDAIARDYPIAELYEKRFEEICRLMD